MPRDLHHKRFVSKRESAVLIAATVQAAVKRPLCICYFVPPFQFCSYFLSQLVQAGMLLKTGTCPPINWNATRTIFNELHAGPFTYHGWLNTRTVVRLINLIGFPFPSVSPWSRITQRQPCPTSLMLVSLELAKPLASGTTFHVATTLTTRQPCHASVVSKEYACLRMCLQISVIKHSSACRPPWRIFQQADWLASPQQMKANPTKPSSPPTCPLNLRPHISDSYCGIIF